MRPLLGDSRQRSERRLFDVHARLERARNELAVAEEQFAVVEEAAEEAHIRSLVSETPLADRAWCDAKRHADAMRRALEAARATVGELERTQDELISRLVP
jgi:chromosome segregation ATPase